MEILKKQTKNKGVDKFLTALEDEIEEKLPNCATILPMLLEIFFIHSTRVRCGKSEACSIISRAKSLKKIPSRLGSSSALE